MFKIIIRDVHKIVISSIDNNNCKVTFYEKMGERWVKLGNSEIWSTIDAIETYM